MPTTQYEATASSAPQERDIAAPKETSARIAAISAQGLATTLVYADEAYLNKMLLTPRGALKKPTAEGLQDIALRIGEMQNLAPTIAIAVTDVANFEKEHCTGESPYNLTSQQAGVAEQLLVQGIALRRQFIDLLAQIKDVSPDLLTQLLKNISNPIEYPATKEARLATLSINEENLQKIKESVDKTITKIGSQKESAPKSSISNISVEALASEQNKDLPKNAPSEAFGKALATRHQTAVASAA